MERSIIKAVKMKPNNNGQIHIQRWRDEADYGDNGCHGKFYERGKMVVVVFGKERIKEKGKDASWMKMTPILARINI